MMMEIPKLLIIYLMILKIEIRMFKSVMKQLKTKKLLILKSKYLIV